MVGYAVTCVNSVYTSVTFEVTIFWQCIHRVCSLTMCVLSDSNCCVKKLFKISLKHKGIWGGEQKNFTKQRETGTQIAPISKCRRFASKKRKHSLHIKYVSNFFVKKFLNKKGNTL